MNTGPIWDALGELPAEELSFVLTRLFALYESRIQQNQNDPEALLFFHHLDLAITQTCQCNSNRR